MIVRAGSGRRRIAVITAGVTLGAGLIVGSAASTTPAGAATTGSIAIDGGHQVLAERARASTAVRRLGLATIQRLNPGLPAATVRSLVTDPTTWVDRAGRLFAVDPGLPGPPLPAAPAVEEAVVDPVNTAPHAPSEAFELESKPGSSRVIYLDFDGATVTGTAWSSSPLVAGAFDLDGDPATFDDRERAFIEDVWLRVAEDYAPFDVNVTTKDPGAAAITRSGAGDTLYGTTALFSMGDAIRSWCGCGGIAYLGVFDETSGHASFQPAWVFPQSLGMSSKAVAEAASHEVGHNLGLSHDGKTSGTGAGEYYYGQGAWAPIMGVGYDEPITQFSAGGYTASSNTEDDIQIIQGHGLALRTDDHGNTAGTATALPGASFDTEGIIERSTDVDVFTTTVAAGTLTVFAYAGATGPNVDLQVRLVNNAGTQLAISDPTSAEASEDLATGLSASVSATVPAGTYTIWVKGVGAGDAGTGYPAYGSLGHYRLSSQAPTLTVAVDGASGPTITSDPAGISCPGTCSATFGLDQQVTLTATEPLGTNFTTWTGAACSSSVECTVVMAGPRTLTGRWATLTPVDLTVSRVGSGTGSVVSSPAGINCGATCTAQYYPGQLVQLTATPAVGSVVGGWSQQGCSGTTCAVSVEGATTVSVTFALARSLSLTISGEAGYVDDGATLYCDSSCTDEYPDGAVVSLTPHGFGTAVFSAWTGACTGSTVPCVVTMDQARTVGATFVAGAVLSLDVETALGAAFQLTDVGSVTVNPGNGQCSEQFCSFAFLPGTVVTLTRSEGPRGAFAGWTGECSGMGTQCQLTMSVDRSVGATFTELDRFKLTLAHSGSGRVTSQPAGINCTTSCSAFFDADTVVTLSAVAGSGATFLGWFADGCEGTGQCVVTMASDQDVEASFSVPVFALDVSVTGTGTGTVDDDAGWLSCNVSCSAEYDAGTVVVLTATPSTGSSFVSWSGACTGSGDCSVTVDQARSVGARFDKNTVLLSVTRSGAGSGSVTSSPSGINCGLTCSAAFEVGSDVWLTATAALGSSVTGWSGACAVISGNLCKVSMSSPKSVTATFALLPPATASAVPGNKVAVLSWSNLTAPGSSPITDYVIQRSRSNGAWTTVRDGKSTVATYTVKSLTNGTSYRFRVAALRGSSQGPWAETGATVPRTTPGTPRSLVAKAGDGQLSLTWKAPSSNGGAAVSDYVVEISTNGLTWSVFADGTSTTTATVITGLTNGVQYRVRVAAKNIAGTGTRTSAKKATPKAV